MSIHADCPEPVWNGTSWECRNHSPPIEVPRARTPQPSQKPVASQASRVQQALRDTAAEEQVKREEAQEAEEELVTRAAEAMASLEAVFGEARAEMTTHIESLQEMLKGHAEMVERIEKLEGSVGASHIMDNVVHVQKLYGRIKALEQKVEDAAKTSGKKKPRK